MKEHKIAALRTIIAKLNADLYGRELIQNTLRGIFAEYMVAEALGPECRIVSDAWNAWDLELGDRQAAYPQRIRIQVKNTARTQTWHKRTGKLTDCQWSLSMRNRPKYFTRDNPGIPCEDYGYLCDAFILCHHPQEDWTIADHRDLDQWEFYVVPVTPHHNLFPLLAPATLPGKPRSYTVLPSTLRKGIRGRPPLKPVGYMELTAAYVRNEMQRLVR